MTAYYNEHDPFAARWLRELIKAGHIPAGDVDERSIEDVTPDEVVHYTQCHFFAGIGGWSYALRLAGWPDDKPVWTGSAPCQPFSAAGAGAGFADERHLWPAFFWLISQLRPSVIFGEQVASKLGRAWFDVVSSDLEAHGYAVGAADLCAAGVGAPHIRQRLFFVANSNRDGWRGRHYGYNESQNGKTVLQNKTARAGTSGVMADTDGKRLERERPDNHQAGREKADIRPDRLRNGAGIGNPWSDVEWLPCIDGKARPVKPGIQPLAHGVPAKVGRLRGYGNAIVPQVAEVFIRSFMEAVQ